MSTDVAPGLAGPGSVGGPADRESTGEHSKASKEKTTSPMGDSPLSKNTGRVVKSKSEPADLTVSEPALKMRKVRRPYVLRKQRESWSPEEHERFLEALARYGRLWTQVQRAVKTKTAEQIRSHAQKYFIQLEKRRMKAQATGMDLGANHSHPSPRKTAPPSDPLTTRTEIVPDKERIVSNGRGNGLGWRRCIPYANPVETAARPGPIGAVANGQPMMLQYSHPAPATGPLQTESGYVPLSAFPHGHHWRQPVPENSALCGRYYCYGTLATTPRLKTSEIANPYQQHMAPSTFEVLGQGRRATPLLPRIVTPGGLETRPGPPVNRGDEAVRVSVTDTRAADRCSTTSLLSSRCDESVKRAPTANSWISSVSMGFAESHLGPTSFHKSERSPTNCEKLLLTRSQLPNPIEPWGGARMLIESSDSASLTHSNRSAQRVVSTNTQPKGPACSGEAQTYEYTRRALHSLVIQRGALSAPIDSSGSTKEISDPSRNLCRVQAARASAANAETRWPSKQMFISKAAPESAGTLLITTPTQLPSVSVLLSENAAPTLDDQRNRALHS
jgi:SHAQKYF class myb-like DNA-binding protein